MSRKRPFRAAFSEAPNLYHALQYPSNYIKIAMSYELLDILEEQEAGKISILMATSLSGDSCASMRGILNTFATKLPQVTFIEGDVDKNEELAKSHKIECIPTFVIYKDKRAIDRIDGAFPEKLKASLMKATGLVDWTTGDDQQVQVPPDSQDMIHYVDMKKCECLNCSDSTPFEDFVSRQGRLVSDCDEELILTFGFNQQVMLHYLNIKAPCGKGPELMKVFINQLTSVDFDDAKRLTSTQEFSLTEKDVSGHTLIEFDRYKFKAVTNIVVYISCNQSGGDVTELDSLTLYGAPVSKKKGVSGHKTELVTLD